MWLVLMNTILYLQFMGFFNQKSCIVDVINWFYEKLSFHFQR